MSPSRSLALSLSRSLALSLSRYLARPLLRLLSIPTLLLSPLSIADSHALENISVSITENAGGLTAELQVSAGPAWTLALQPRSYRSDGFSVFLDTAGGLVPFDAPPLPTYSGVVAGVPGSLVAGGFSSGRLTATILLPGESWHLEPMPVGDQYLLYRHDEILPPQGLDGVCGINGAAVSPQAALLGPGNRAEVSYDVDYDLYTIIHAQNPTSTVEQVEIAHAQVQLAFDPLGLEQEIRFIVIRTQSGQPYTPHDPQNPVTLCGLLGEVNAVWDQSGAPLLETDGVQLLTYREGDGSLLIGCNVPGSAGGFANVPGGCGQSCPGGGAICLDQPTSIALYLPVPSWRLVVTAHEWGHLWGAGHCCSVGADCGIMCGILPGSPTCDPNPCLFTPLFEFDSSAEAAMTTFAGGASCLTPVSPVLLPPLNEQFPVIAGSLQPPVWTFVIGATVLQPSPPPPTPPHALSLANGAYPATDLRTGKFDLTVLGDWHVSFRVKPNGLALGEILTVQYLLDDSSWQTLFIVRSDDLDPAAYGLRAAPVPVDSLASEFRVRFFIPEHGATGSWLIDDFRIQNGPPAPVPGLPPTVTQVLPGNSYLASPTTLAIFGQDFTDPTPQSLPATEVMVGSRNWSGSAIDYQSSSELRVTLPIGGPFPPVGWADVTVDQAGGSDTLVDGFRFHGNFVHDTTFKTPTAPATMTASIRATLTDPIAAYSFGVGYDAAIVTFLGLTSPPFAFPPFNGTPPDTVFVGSGVGYWTLGVILDAIPVFPPWLLPTGSIELARIDLSVLQGQQKTTLAISEQFPPMPSQAVAVVMVDAAGEAIFPGFSGTAGGVQPSFASFSRGDANVDGSVNIADAIHALGFLFPVSAPITTDCRAAFDANDDALVNIADPIYLLGYLFVGGPPPPAPFSSPVTACGIDLTSPGCDVESPLCP